MLRHGTQTFTQYHLPDHLGVDNDEEGKVVNPMCVVRLAEGLCSEVDVDVTECKLYKIVKSTTQVVDNVEKPIAAIPGSKATYLYSVNHGPGCTLAALAGFAVPQNKDESGAFYCKYTVDFTDLAVHGVDMNKLHDSIKYHWSVNTEDEYYRNHLSVAPYELAVVTSSVKTTKPTSICVEVVWVESVDGDVLNGKTYTDDSELPTYKETGMVSKTDVSPSLTLAYQYALLEVDDSGGMQLQVAPVAACAYAPSTETSISLSTEDGWDMLDGESEEKGCALPIIKLTGNNQYELDRENLKAILTRPEVRGQQVAVVSIVGVKRTGKSFMLNMIKKCLEGKQVKDCVRSSGNDGRSDEIFSWVKGDEAHTMGLLMWSKPFIVKRANDKVAVLLMDTQGIFDNKSTQKSCATIFALSTFISSLQIFNIQRQIQEDYLRHLQYFTEYGKLVSKSEDHKPFQNLLFLIRDYPAGGSHEFGYAGGKKYLESNLQYGDDAHSEQKEVRDNIRAMFQSYMCFLMPRPAEEVMDGKPFDFNNPLENCKNESFVQHTQDFVDGILLPKRLKVKTHSGNPMTAEDFLLTVQILATIFTRDELPNIKLVLEVSSDAECLVAVANCQKHFEHYIQKFVEQKKMMKVLSAHEFDTKFHKLKSQAIAEFKMFPKFSKLPKYEQYMEDLCCKIDGIGTKYQAQLIDIPTEEEAKLNCEGALNSCSSYFRTQAQKFYNAKKTADTLEKEEITKFFKNLEDTTRKRFKLHDKLGSEAIRMPVLEALEQEMTNTRTNKEEELSKIPTMEIAVSSQKEAVRDAAEYFRQKAIQAMQSELEKESPNASYFEKQLIIFEGKALKKFNRARKLGGEAMTAKYLEELRSIIEKEKRKTTTIVKNHVCVILAKNDAINYKAYSVCVSKFTSIMDTFLDEQKRVETAEPVHIDEKYYIARAECLAKMVQFDPSVQIQPKYLDKFNEICTKKQMEVWNELRDKPTMSELKQKNDEVVTKCLDMYKRDCSKFIADIKKKGTYRGTELRTNHDSCEARAIAEYEKCAILGGEKYRKEYRQNLTLQIIKHFDDKRRHLEDIIFTEHEASGRNNDFVEHCFVQYLKKMRKEAHYNWKIRSWYCKYSTWFDNKGPDIKKECVDEYNKYCVGTTKIAGQHRAELERRIDERFLMFRDKKDAWFKLNAEQAMAYYKGEYKLPDEELTSPGSSNVQAQDVENDLEMLIII